MKEFVYIFLHFFQNLLFSTSIVVKPSKKNIKCDSRNALILAREAWDAKAQFKIGKDA